MFCPSCGKEIPDHSQFCLACGKAIAPTPTPRPEASKTCEYCKAQIPKSANTCRFCGKPATALEHFTTRAFTPCGCLMLLVMIPLVLFFIFGVLGSIGSAFKSAGSFPQQEQTEKKESADLGKRLACIEVKQFLKVPFDADMSCVAEEVGDLDYKLRVEIDGKTREVRARHIYKKGWTFEQ
jgi:hypothetical protein